MASRTHITNEERLEYCKKENKMQFFVYKKKVEKKTMTPEEANLNYQAMAEYKELVMLLEQKGLNYYLLIENLKKLDDK